MVDNNLAIRICIPAVNYADFLSVLLPRWKAFLPSAEIIVVTALDDEGIRVAEENGVKVHATDIWTRQIPVDNEKEQPVIFNKAAALNEGFGFSGSFIPPPAEDSLCLSIDADVVPFGTFPEPIRIKSNYIYSCPRYYCDTPEELEAADLGKLKLKLIPPKLKGQNYGIADPKLTPRSAASRCLGYYQLFRHKTGRDFGSFATAGGYDLRFRDKFPHKTYIESMYVLHLGEQDRANWKGRVIKPWHGNS